MSRKVYVASTLVSSGRANSSVCFYYLPYYVTKPGMAKELEPIIEVSGGDEAEGSFYANNRQDGESKYLFLFTCKVE